MPRSVAVVGSGPGGMYVVQALLEQAPDCRIDVIDRLPTPYGLIRGGVAPDHQTTKKVSKTFDKSVLSETVRFIGNVEVGRDVGVDQLLDIYDAVVLAYGAPFDNRLGIPGEDLPGVFGSNEFVGWYNAHPDFRTLSPDLDIQSAVVIGIGNVAVDVARVLAKTPDEMRTTDIADYAAASIHASPLTDIYMFGRRGPIEAAFTNVELRELGNLADCAPVLDPAQLPAALPDGLESKLAKIKGNILKTLHGLAEATPEGRRKRLHIGFYAAPVAVLGETRVTGIRMERTRVEDGRCIGTGETFDIPCGLVVTCIGSRAQPIDGVPFDQTSGIVVHDGGCIAPRLYAAGWVKRGATGTIGANRLDSYDVAARVTGGFDGKARPGPAGLDALLAARGIRATDFADWQVIDRLETDAATAPAPRRKFAEIETMLAALDKQRKAG